ncbi:MAG TPA: lipopolysaccharide biosynthesis protein [Gemmatimonadales bacterium]|nr:lipopolysaccharide biosynthesis protein [Gemmatimonadales bacterium]
MTSRASGFGAKLGRLGSESLVYGLSTILGRFLGYLLQPFYVSQFAPADNGIQTLVYVLLSLVSVPFLMGLDVAYMRNSAAIDQDPDPVRSRQRAFTMSFAMVATMGIGLVAIGFALIPWAGRTFGLPHTALRYLLLIVYTDTLLAIPWATLRMTNRAVRFAILRLCFVGLSIVLNIVFIVGLHWGVEAIFLANLLANLALLVVFIPEIARLFRPAMLGRGSGWRALWAYALPIVPASFAVMLVENADRLLLNQISPAAAQAVYGLTPKQVVGIYGFNYKLGVVMLLVVQMFRMAWTPFMLTQARDPQAPQLFSRVLTALALVCSVVFLGVALYLPAVVRIPVVFHIARDPAYWLGLPIVPVILLGYAFSGMYAVVSSGLYIERRTGILPWIAGAGAVLNVIVCWVAASRWGMVAVAAATPLSYGLMTALGAWQAGRFYRVPYEWGRVLHIAVIVLGLYLLDRWLAHGGAMAALGSAFAIKTALLLAFPLLLWLTRFFRAGEWRALRGLVRRGA